jgi:hypothetical protein
MSKKNSLFTPLEILWKSMRTVPIDTLNKKRGCYDYKPFSFEVPSGIKTHIKAAKIAEGFA